MRAELGRPETDFFDTQTYNELFTVHASLMIFLFIIPAFAGLANYVLPLMIGAPDMAFPRLNALSYWLLPIAGIMLLFSFFFPGVGAGWTNYPPLSTTQPFGNVFFSMAVQWAGASSIMTALNFLVTIITMRAPGMTFWRMPLLVWANFTTSLLVVIATPFIAGSQFFVMFDKIMHTNFFEVDGGGYPLGYQHIFWFYSHPAVYIMMLPGFGIVSEVISTFSRKPIFGYRLMALSLMAMFLRAELAKPGMQIVDPQGYNGLFSVHASLMIFLFIIPAFAGLANFVVPLMLGAPDMAFPRLNALSYWLLPIAGIMMLVSFFFPGFGAGWTNYAPLAIHQPFGNVFFSMAVQWAGASSIMTALNFLVTIITMRAPGMTFWRMPLLVWANFTTSLLVVIATPFIAGSQFFVMFDKVMHTNFFDPENNGYVLGYQHIFWFYSHPAVYIMMLPGFGIASEVISVFSRKPIFGYRLMALSLMAILVLGFSVWAHNMFVSGMAPYLRVPMMVTTLLIAVPTGIKVFSWLATLWEGKLNLAAPMLWALGFVTMFTIGGLSGIML
ncbi:MAG TPA: cbb3-type cytochrome c oxidase subunit I, partial [Vicinamibacterales bacterium]|nr:cbb3-type cytochrome c oxidase subunit I [Vicinamibacterales bacterium]